MKFMILYFIGLLFTVKAFAQTYLDVPFIQDFAEKFELGPEQEKIKLLNVRSDRNGFINVVSSEGLLLPFEKGLVKNRLYRPMADLKIFAVERYENQFVYLSTH